MNFFRNLSILVSIYIMVENLGERSGGWKNLIRTITTTDQEYVSSNSLDWENLVMSIYNNGGFHYWFQFNSIYIPINLTRIFEYTLIKMNPLFHFTDQIQVLNHNIYTDENPKIHSSHFVPFILTSFPNSLPFWNKKAKHLSK